jgi:hypothetical protein
MAKSKAETRTLLRAIVDMGIKMRAYLQGDFEVDYEAISTALAAGGDEPEDSFQIQRLDTLKGAAQNMYQAWTSMMWAIHPSLGRLASSPNLEDVQSNIDAFNDYLHTGGESVESRGLVKFTSMTAGGSNYGTGKVLVHTTGANGEEMDISHIETLTLKCVSDFFSGSTLGREAFQIYGEALTAYNWNSVDVGGTATTGGFTYTYGKGLKDFSPRQESLKSGDNLTSVNGSNGSGNLVNNGDLESRMSGSGSAKLPEWTISAGDTTLLEQSTYIKGAYSIKATGNFTMYQNITNQDKMRAKSIHGMSIMARTDNAGAGTVTGTLTFKVRAQDDSADYGTITIDLSTLTPGNPGTVSQNTTTFVLPQTAKPLKFEVVLASIGGTAATPTVTIDEIVCTPMVLVDGGRALAIISGVSDWRYNDLWTGETTEMATANPGEIQRAVNEVFQRFFKHSNAGSYWSDV